MPSVTIPVASTFLSSPSALAAGEDAANLYLRASLWRVAHGSDTVPRVALDAITRRQDAADLADRLVSVGLWARTFDGWRFSADEHRAHVSAVRAEAGRKGGFASGAKRRTEEWECHPRPPERNRQHPDSRNTACKAEYTTWRRMLSRCAEKKNERVRAIYFDRGIKVCQRWRDDFRAFLDDMGRRPEGKNSIDRINGDRGYECGSSSCADCGPTGATPNCRWADDYEQNQNKSSNVHLTHDGITMTMSQWARRLGVRHGVLHSRIFTHGWSVERALTEPMQGRG